MEFSAFSELTHTQQQESWRLRALGHDPTGAPDDTGRAARPLLTMIPQAIHSASVNTGHAAPMASQGPQQYAAATVPRPFPQNPVPPPRWLASLWRSQDPAMYPQASMPSQFPINAVPLRPLPPPDASLGLPQTAPRTYTGQRSRSQLLEDKAPNIFEEYNFDDWRRGPGFITTQVRLYMDTRVTFRSHFPPHTWSAKGQTQTEWKEVVVGEWVCLLLSFRWTATKPSVLHCFWKSSSADADEWLDLATHRKLRYLGRFDESLLVQEIS